MHSLGAIYVMWRRDLLRLARDRARLVASLAQPMLWLIIIGSGLSPAMRFPGVAQTQGFDYLKFMFPGVVGMTLLFTSMFSAISVAWDREFGFLKEILVAPVPRWAVAVGKILGGSTVAVVQGLVMLAIAPFLGVAFTPEVALTLLPLMFLLSFAISSMGLVVAVHMKTMEGFQVVMQFLMMPMFMLSGAVFPLQNIPDWMNVLVHINPVAYGVDPIRQVALSATLPPSALQALAFNSIQVDLAVEGAFAAVMVVLAVWRFREQQ